VNEVVNEFEILKTLDHPNIVRLFEMYVDEKHFYLISEYCEGGELFDRIKKAKFFSEEMVAKYMFQIISAVLYCHNRKVAHRDLKPENILFVTKQNDEQLKLIDFGVSSNFNRSSKLRDKQGTVR
jgi:calcium-dependent protein kinase